MTQGEPFSPIILNVVEDAVLWQWVTVVADMEDTWDPSTEGFGRDIQRLAAYFYADDGLMK